MRLLAETARDLKLYTQIPCSWSADKKAFLEICNKPTAVENITTKERREMLIFASRFWNF